MADYISEFEGKEIDRLLNQANAVGLGLSTLEREVHEMRSELANDITALETHSESVDTQLADHETRITNNYHSTLAIGGVATANKEAIEVLQGINETNSTRFSAMDQQITELYSSAAANASSSAVNASAIGMSRRNLLPNIASSITKGGITFTVNDDGSVTASGTASANTQLDIGKFPLTAGTEYILSGCPDGGSESSYYLYGLYTSNWAGLGGKDTGSGYKFTAQWSGEVVFRVYITSGTTIDNLTFYPMLRYAAIEDGTYETYTPSLLERIEALEAKILSLTTEVSE